MGFYLLKLLWMSLASFFLVHLATGLLVWGIAPCAIRAADRMRASSASRFLLAVRLFPCAFSVSVVLALCVPSYLWLEPDVASEEMSLPCFAAAILCAAVWTISLMRSAWAAGRSLRYLRHCRNSAWKLDSPAYPVRGWVIDDNCNSIELAGIFRPRVVVGRQILGALTHEQFDAAMRHEWAHAVSLDNLKKLLILLVPDVLPFVRAGFAELDRSWARFAEWAADDRAAAGDPWRSLSLAAALVAVARMGVAPRMALLTTSLVAQPEELSVRVNRLLEVRPETKSSRRRTRLIGAALTLVALFVAIGLGPTTLYAVHELLENWAR